MKRLAVIPSDALDDYLKQGMSPQWLEEYYNPGNFFDEVYVLSELEKDREYFLGMKTVHTQAGDFSARVRDLKIDVVRAYGGNWACSMACDNKVENVPVIVSVHDKDPARLYDSIKNADVVWSVSRVVQQLVATKFKNKDRQWLLPNRVNMDVMHPRNPQELIALNALYPFKYKILFVGRLSKEKNLDTLIKAIGILGPNYGAVIIGSGDSMPYMELAHGHRVQQRVFFVESVAHEELSLYYSWADCMCTPSRAEGFGMVFIEAMACGGVVATSNIPPMNEYIVDGQNGLLIDDYQDAPSVAMGIRRACETDSLRALVKSKARGSVMSFEKKHIEKMESDYYQRVLSMRDKGEFKPSFWQQWLTRNKKK